MDVYRALGVLFSILPQPFFVIIAVPEPEVRA